MERSLAVTEPDRMESLSSPSLTSRPSAWRQARFQHGAERVGIDQEGQRERAEAAGGRKTAPTMRTIRFIGV